MSDIPEARKRLRELAEEQPYLKERLSDVMDLLTRQSPVRRTRKRIPALTPDMISSIRKYAAIHPDKSQLDIAIQYGTNPGRVSEALNGKV